MYSTAEKAFSKRLHLNKEILLEPPTNNIYRSPTGKISPGFDKKKIRPIFRA
jgi:hypothetical protein